MLNSLFKSVLDQDRMQIVICDMTNTIVYMNDAAIKEYGKDLTGNSIFDCHDNLSVEKINRVLDWFLKSEDNNIIHTFYNAEDKRDVYMVALRENGKLIGYYEKHELRVPDNMPFYNIK